MRALRGCAPPPNVTEHNTPILPTNDYLHDRDNHLVSLLCSQRLVVSSISAHIVSPHQQNGWGNDNDRSWTGRLSRANIVWECMSCQSFMFKRHVPRRLKLRDQGPQCFVQSGNVSTTVPIRSRCTSPPLTCRGLRLHLSNFFNNAVAN